jgi:hypothetical protein
MQRLTSEYRALLILAAANAGASLAPGAAVGSRDYGPDRRSGHREVYRDFEDFDIDHRGIEHRDLYEADHDDQPTYWYWSYDHPDAGL